MAITMGAMAQQRYAFDAADYVSTDDARAPQSAFSYDAAANTFTINAAGANNIAFKMDKDRADGKYFIGSEQHYYVVEATNLSTSTLTNSYVWWFNGANNFSQEPAKWHFTTADGTQLAVWDIATNAVMKTNMDFTKERIDISSHGNQIINALGLTSKSSSSTIRRIDYLEKYGLAALYPTTWSRLGYNATSLTEDIRAHILATETRSEELLAKGNIPELAAALATARTQEAALGQTDYTQAYATLRALEDVLFEACLSVPVSAAEAIPGGVHVQQGDLHTYVLFYNGHVARILRSHATLQAIDKLSMSVIKQADTSLALTVDTSDKDLVSVASDYLRLTISRADGHVTAYRADGTQLVAEKPNGTQMTERNAATPYDTYTIRTTFQLEDDECVYGLGQIQDGDLNQRGKSVHLEQENMKVCIPYLMSTKAYAIFWDNYSPTNYTDDQRGTSFESTGSEIDYYILAGDNCDDVTKQTRWLTGDAPMMPLWNFGLYQSKERYRSATETMNVIREYRRRHIPIDCVVQDWQYWGPENDHTYWNSLSFLNTEYFSNYQEMIDDIHANNAHLLISFWGNFGSNTPGYKALKPLGRMIPVISYPNAGGVEPIDVWSNTAQDTFWRLLYNGLVSKGVDAYWMDSTEPDYGKRSDSELDYISECKRSWRTLRNSFVLGHISGVYNHQRERQLTDAKLAQKRVSILTRSGFVGQQRYAAQTWSGDISASWETLQRQIPAALNFTACGIPYWNNDNGAFFVGYNWGANGPFADDNYRRLFLRWTQFSTFTGMLRFHGSGHNCEIWQMGEPGDADGQYAEVEKYIRMRYSLLPYLYSTAWQVTHNHASLMTALPLAFTSDRNCYDRKYQYMFGQSLLVCPVVNEGQTITHNYLPAGTRWIDFWTGQSLEGGQTVTKQAPEDIIPLYVRAGSILPWGPRVEYSTEKAWDQLEMRIYPGANGDFTLYEDENDNYNYEHGAYTEIPFHWDDATQTLSIGERTGDGFPGMLRERTFNVVLVNTLRGAGDGHSSEFSATIHYDGTPVEVQLDDVFTPGEEEDVTSSYIVNPSFENGMTGWKTDINTAWSGINVGGGAGDPQATDGTHIFGVWDPTDGRRAKISQRITLPRGDYRMTVDMHCSDNGAGRVGDQHLFADAQKALFRDQVSTPGRGDATPMSTVELEFSVDDDQATIEIGVNETKAPNATWYKIDNFRLYHVTTKAHLTSGTDAISKPTATTSASASEIYTISGLRVTKPQRGVNIIGGRKVIH